MDHYAADAFAVVEHLNLGDAVHIGHSTGGGEVARYVAKYGEPSGRVAKAVLVSAVPPLTLKTASNPEGLPIADAALKSVRLLKRGKLKVYAGYPHGMLTTHADVINPDLLAFITG